MQRNLLIFCVIVLFVGTIIALNINSVESQSDRVQRGKYLVDTVGACGHCHTPRAGAEYNMDMYLAGHPTNAPYPRYNFSMMQQGIFILTSPTNECLLRSVWNKFLLKPDTGQRNWVGGLDRRDVHQSNAYWTASRCGGQPEDLSADANEALCPNER